jgi:hypothetical protein
MMEELVENERRQQSIVRRGLQQDALSRTRYTMQKGLGTLQVLC